MDGILKPSSNCDIPPDVCDFVRGMQNIKERISFSEAFPPIHVWLLSFSSVRRTVLPPTKSREV